MQTPVSSLPLSPPVKVKLLKAGFQSAADLLHIKPLQLSKEAGVSPEEAVEVLQTVKSRVGGADGAGSAAGGQVTALDLLEQEEALGSILTFCSQLDAALGGGLPVGKTTEICGPPGVGKTQLCLQVCVDVQVPECFGGLGGQAVFVDTEGSFLVHRLAELAEAAVQHLSRLAEDQQQTDALRDFTVETILSNVFVVRCHDYTDLLAELYLLPDFLSRLQKPRLLVIDSVASPFRRHDDMSQRTRLLNTLAQQLIAMATSHHVAVVMTNQMTTRVGGGGSQSELVPALGESWGHAPTLRLMLQWAGSERRASLYKTPNQRETSVSYQITAHGFRDTDTSTDQSQHAQASTSQSADTYNLTIQSGSHNKRARIQED